MTIQLSSIEQQRKTKALLEKSSIVTGYNKLDYETTLQNSNKLTDKIIGNRSDEKKKIQDMKRGLRATHFSLGDAGESYDTTSKQLDPTGEMHKYTAVLDINAKKMLRTTSATLGYESSAYETSYSNASKWSKEDMKNSTQLCNETKKNTGPKKINYDFGDESINYVSTTKAAYTYDASEYKRTVMAESVKKDLRACHFSLGHSPLDYSTSGHIKKVSAEQIKKNYTPVAKHNRETSVSLC